MAFKHLHLAGVVAFKHLRIALLYVYYNHANETIENNRRLISALERTIGESFSELWNNNSQDKSILRFRPNIHWLHTSFR